jgi:hypothetical protein
VLDSGSGSVDIAPSLEQVERGEGDEGVWEAPGYSASDQKLLIIFEDIGSGSVRVQ